MDRIYQHYRSEEQPFIDLVLGWMQQVENAYAPYLTPFLTPREAMIARQLVATNDDLQIGLDGGYPQAERQRAVIYPLYYQLLDDDFDLAVLNVNYPTKFGELSHGRILGTLMSTGLERDRIGDIITDGSRWHLIVDETMVDYLKQQVNKIANVGVHLQVIDPNEILESSETWQDDRIVVSSLRLDTLLSNVYHFSRQRAKEAVYAGQVKVNFVQVDRPDIFIGVNDIVSLRKYGRFWINEVEGITRKDNYRIHVSILER